MKFYQETGFTAVTGRNLGQAMAHGGEPPPVSEKMMNI
jgi:hypothetical protein